MTEDEVEVFPNNVEGPLHKETVKLDWLQYKSLSPTDQSSKLIEDLGKQLPNNQLRAAFLDEGDNFMYRAFTRKSNGENMLIYGEEIPNSTIGGAYDNIHSHGIEVDKQKKESVDQMSPYQPYVRFVLPSGQGDDRSYILVYKRAPFIYHTRKTEDGKVLVGNRGVGTYGGQYKNIEEAVRDYPTLRDLLVGVVEVEWDFPEERKRQWKFWKK